MTSGVITVELVVVAMLLGALWFFTSRRTKGKAGEWMVGLALRGLGSREYRVLNNIYLPLPDGTTSQIDHIVVSRYGLFVIETKNYKGWIFCDRDSKVWTQCLSGKGYRKPIKNTFPNPIRQNYSHLCAIENCTTIPKVFMHPVVTFSGEATFKTNRPEGVCYFGSVVSYIKSFTKPIIKDRQVDEIASAILEWQATLTKSQKANHVSNLKRRHERLLRVTDSSPRCPFCGAPMVMRTRKSDGGHFYGCSTYPKCTGIVNIRERI